MSWHEIPVRDGFLRSIRLRSRTNQPTRYDPTQVLVSDEPLAHHLAAAEPGQGQPTTAVDCPSTPAFRCGGRTCTPFLIVAMCIYRKQQPLGP